jgi:hypothetical protein
MKLTPEEARDVVYEDHADWRMVKGTKHPVDQRRWSVDYEAIFLHQPSGKFYEFGWSQGATESQDERAYEYEDSVEVVEVVEREVTIKQWVPA